ncbi:MAG: enoyl-CoA hydratase/isomerase family protein [Gammaproteobacteria bacterium]|nr:MAG: enoyl-CoA hydratase/isomerase family protein [Gammaproteobacteria bacterium]RLA50085.1 MAG: enoyl-CoA hydratase/isomerase family protein [Gammaproteobacteria bacterium]
MADTASNKTVTIKNEGAVRYLTLNRPDKLNAMNRVLSDELSAALSAADKDPDVAVMVITGEGRAFCAGADLSGSGESPPSREIADEVSHSITFYQQMVTLNTPMIAAVHGYALGGGCNLAISCDMVVAADNAVFGYPEVKLGMPAAGVSPPLVHQIGRKAAFELLVLCENINAEKALEFGMINRIVAPDQLMSTATGIAEQLAGYDHDALWLTKQLIRRCADMPLPSALELGRDIALAAGMYK